MRQLDALFSQIVCVRAFQSNLAVNSIKLRQTSPIAGLLDWSQRIKVLMVILTYPVRLIVFIPHHLIRHVEVSKSYENRAQTANSSHWYTSAK